MSSESFENVDVVAFLPGDALRAQLAEWQQRGDGRTVRYSRATEAAEVRRAVRSARVAIVDASRLAALAIDVFAQAAERGGASTTSMYTETLHDGLELTVRQQGSWLLFGPLDGRQWDELLERLLGIAGRMKPGDLVLQRETRRLLDETFSLRTHPRTRPTAIGFRRPRSHVR